MKRRTFLELAAALGSVSLNACSKGELPPLTSTSYQGPWGGTVPERQFSLLDSVNRPEGVLELFLLGGMSPWETFYAAPEHGDPQRNDKYANQQWWSFQSPETGLSVSDWYTACTGTTSELLKPWVTDSQGIQVFLGPFIHALRERPDILSRMRVWVMRHDTEPHELGIPLAMCGLPLGNPRMASLGSHIQRYFQERQPERTAPHAYTIYMNALQLGAAGRAASAVGLHRASARPMEIGLSRNPTLPVQLPRPTVEGFRTELDQVLHYYLKRSEARMGRTRYPDLRSPGFDDYAFAQATMQNHQTLSNLLSVDLLTSKDIEICLPQPVAEGPGNVILDEVATGLRTATHLLTHPTHAARFVQFVDSGIYTDPVGQGYDAHGAHVTQSATNIHHLASTLVKHVNEPGEDDPNKLDLSRHFILLNTEFGRSPYPEVSPRNPHGGGTDHWPWGYVVVGFGGFVDEERQGLVGSIGPDGRAIDYITPAEHRAAMLSAMGIWPFTEEGFAVGDIRSANTELDAAVYLREHVLGYGA